MRRSSLFPIFSFFLVSCLNEISFAEDNHNHAMTAPGAEASGGAGAGAPADLQAIAKQIADLKYTASLELSAALAAKAQCANDQQQATNNARVQSINSKADALGDVAAPLLGQMMGSSHKNAAKAKIDAEAKKKKAFDEITDAFKVKKIRTEAELSSNTAATRAINIAYAADCDAEKLKQVNPKTKQCASVTGCTCPLADDMKGAAFGALATYQEALKDIKDASSITNEKTVSTISTALSSLGTGMKLHGASVQNDGAKQNAAFARQECDRAADAAIQAVNKKLQDIDFAQSRNLLNAGLMNSAAEQNKNKATPMAPQAGGGVMKIASSGTVPTKASPSGAPGGTSADAAANSGGGGGGGAPAGGGGGGGGGGANWTFGGGGGGGNSGNFGMPVDLTPYDSTATGGGGGGGLFGDFGFGSDPYGNNANNPQDTYSGAPLMGDGGLNVLMIRARLRLSSHAPDLVKSIDPGTKKAASVAPPGSDRLPANN